MGKSLPSTLKLEGGLERAGPVPPEQQLHSRRGLGPTLDKISDFTLRVQEKKEKKKNNNFSAGESPWKQGPPAPGLHQTQGSASSRCLSRCFTCRQEMATG